MNEKPSTGTIWNRAATAGIALGAASSIYLFITQYLSSLGTSLWISGVDLVLWGIKLLGCVWLMMFFMKKLAADFDGATGRDTFMLGMLTAMFSALFFAAISLANVLIINPGMIQEQIDAAMKIYGSAMDANSLNAIDKIEGMMPQIIFFTNLIYCFLYGTLLSAILSRNIPHRDPFANFAGPSGDSSQDNQQ